MQRNLRANLIETASQNLNLRRLLFSTTILKGEIDLIDFLRLKILFIMVLAILPAWAEVEIILPRPRPTLTPLQSPVKRDTSLNVIIERHRGEPVVHFQWAHKAAMAAFSNKSGQWFVFFDKPAHLDIQVIQSALSIKLEQIQESPYAVFRIMAPPYFYPFVEQDKDHWTLRMKMMPEYRLRSVGIHTPLKPQEPLVLDVAHLGKHFDFEDPETKNHYWIATSFHPAIGLLQNMVFTEFKLYQTIQGVVIQSYSPDMKIHVKNEQISLSHPKGLTTTSLVQQKENSKRTLTPPPSLFTKDESLDWLSRRRELTLRLVNSRHQMNLNEALELAWLHMVFGRYNEGLGVLEKLVGYYPWLIKNPLFRMLNGFGELMRENDVKADEWLTGVSQEPEVKAWLQIMKIQRMIRKIDKTPDPSELSPLTNLVELKPWFLNYSQAIRDDIVPMVVRDIVALGDFATAQHFLTSDLKPRDASQRRAFDFYQTKKMIVDGMTSESIDRLNEFLKANNNQHIAFLAQFELIKLKLKTRAIDEHEAVESLESLQLRWRGDDDEYRLIYFLADLLKKISRHHHALEYLQRLIDLYPEQAMLDELPQQRAEIFVQYFENDMPAIKSVAFYEEHQQLLPTDERGVKIVKKVANQLIELDLLDKAALLLTRLTEKQEKTNPQELSEVLLKITSIYLLDDNLQAAESFLSRVDGTTLDETNKRHYHLIKAQLLLQQKRYTEAATILQNDESLDALQILRQISLAAQDWKLSADTLKKLLSHEDLPDRESCIVSLSIAYALMNDHAHVQELREKYQETIAKTPHKDLFDMATQGFIHDFDPNDRTELARLMKNIAQVSSFADKFLKDQK